MTQLTSWRPMVAVEEVVTRWVEHPRSVLDGVVAAIPKTIDLGGPVLRLDGPFTRSTTMAHPLWIAHGRAVTPARVRRRGVRVEITVTAWSNDVAEINVRRSGRRVLAWSATREHRYFDLAHRAAEYVAATIAGSGMLAA